MSNIMFLNNSGDVWGGVENWTFKMSKALKKGGHNILIVGRNESPLLAKSKKEGLDIEAIKCIGSASFLNPGRIFEIVKYIKKYSIDVIFFCSSPTFKLGTISAKIANVKHIIYRRGSAIPIKNKFYNRYLLSKTSAFIANSIATKLENFKYIKNYPEDRIHLIYNGVNLRLYLEPELKTDIRREFNIQNNKIIITNIGRLSKQKGQEYLIESACLLKKEFKNFVILFIGEGERENYLKEMVRNNNLQENIGFVGFREDIPSILKQSDFVAHTALWEGCPWAILETMAAGIPVVATDSSSLSEIIIDGVNGYLAKSQDINDISKKLLKMCLLEDREKLGVNARRIAEEKFDFNKVVTLTERIFIN